MEVGSQETVDGFRDEFQYNFSDLEAGVRVSVMFQKVGHGDDWVVQHEASGRRSLEQTFSARCFAKAIHIRNNRRHKYMLRRTHKR